MAVNYPKGPKPRKEQCLPISLVSGSHTKNLGGYPESTLTDSKAQSTLACPRTGYVSTMPDPPMAQSTVIKTANPLNTYTGPDALVKYYDPDHQPPLPLVEIPDKLNPFREDGVRIYAKMMTVLPAHNVKMLPGMGLDVPLTIENRIVSALFACSYCFR